MQKFQIGYIRFKYFSTAKANPLLNHEAESLSIRYGTTKTLNINFRTFGCGSFLQSTDILNIESNRIKYFFGYLTTRTLRVLLPVSKIFQKRKIIFF